MLQDLQLAIDAGLFVLICLAQSIIYPSFHRIDRSSFSEWHARYSARISYIVAPLMIAQLSLGLLALAQNSSVFNSAYLGLVVATWAITFYWSVPCHKQLQTAGYDSVVVDRLISTNWVRVALWALILTLRLAHAGQS